MRIALTSAEVNRIVAQYLIDKGFFVDPDSAQTITETHGSYDDAETVVTGLSFDLKGTNGK